jgi:uncharacterized protein (DUF2384 family)
MNVSVRQLEIRAAKHAIQLVDESLGLNNAQVASAIGVNERTLYRYKSAENAPSPAVVDQLSKLREITQLLSEIFTDKNAQFEWLYSAAPVFRGQRPIDMIKKGDLDKVISILSGVQSGTFI